MPGSDTAASGLTLMDEKRIHETRFDVIKDGEKYDVKVREVYLNR